MKSPEYYASLPDSMDPDELREEFRALVATPTVATPSVHAGAVAELGDHVDDPWSSLRRA